MMTTARKSFLVSLTFHALMGSLAFFLLTQMHTPPPKVKIPLQPMMLVSLSHSKPTPKQPQSSKPIPAVTAQQPIAKQVTPQPIPPAKSIPQSVQTLSSPVATPTPAVQHAIQNIPTPATVPSKPKIDLAAEKRLFFTSLRSTIQNHLRYPSAARRRGMEGEVDVRFTLANDGSINTVSIQRGEAIFHNSVKTAVSSASGIDIPKNLADSLPMEIELTLEFKLNS
ncbi:MAG TPA: TonB family protein [Sulfuricurvum sp.]|nr:TonB family protein [Sulfuricurvum sp.]